LTEPISEAVIRKIAEINLKIDGNTSKVFQVVLKTLLGLFVLTNTLPNTDAEGFMETLHSFNLTTLHCN